jgi:hypothetical protein
VARLGSGADCFRCPLAADESPGPSRDVLSQGRQFERRNLERGLDTIRVRRLKQGVTASGHPLCCV